jgi:hypothetical protein
MYPKLLAKITNPSIPASLGDNGGNGGLIVGTLVGNIVGAIMILAFLLALFYLITGGISWLTSGGDKAQLEQARNKLTHAIIGLIIIASVWAIMNIVGPFLGISFPNLTIPVIQP